MKDALRWLVLSIVLTTALAGIYYQYQNTRPCAHPVRYAVGAIDARFGVTTTTVENDAKTAAAIWNKAAGKEVLTYDPAADLKISFIYDARQANAKLSAEIAQRQKEADSVRNTLDALQSRYSIANTAYNNEVRAVNARGGATQSEAAALDAERMSLNTLSDSIQTQVTSFNASIRALNAVTDQFNQTAGHTFEEGKYVRDAAGERISVFEFVDTVQLERVLAHELGHALGLDHDTDPKSIMYAKNESGNLIPTTADISALRALCGT